MAIEDRKKMCIIIAIAVLVVAIIAAVAYGIYVLINQLQAVDDSAYATYKSELESIV